MIAVIAVIARHRETGLYTLNRPNSAYLQSILLRFAAAQLTKSGN